MDRFSIVVYKEYISFCDENRKELYKLYNDGVFYNTEEPDGDIPHVLFELRDFFNK